MLCIRNEFKQSIYNVIFTWLDFVSLELKDGKPRLLMDYGTGVSKLEIEHSPLLSDGLSHKVHITWNPTVFLFLFMPTD